MPSVPVERLGAVDGRARTRLPNEIDMTIVDSGRKSRVAAAARTAGIASASSSPATTTPERAPVGGFAAHTVGEEHFYGHMLSGALAGTTEHCAMFPLDTIKTRMQTATTSAVAGATLGGSTAPSQSSSRWIGSTATTTLHRFNPVASIRAAAHGVVRSHGVAGLYRGVAAVGIGAGPAHALYFATYEHMKRASASDDGRHHPFHHAFAGACATVVGDAVQTPVDTVKQRLQMHNSPYVGVWDCVKRTVRVARRGWGAVPIVSDDAGDERPVHRHPLHRVRELEDRAARPDQRREGRRGGELLYAIHRGRFSGRTRRGDHHPARRGQDSHADALRGRRVRDVVHGGERGDAAGERQGGVRGDGRRGALQAGGGGGGEWAGRGAGGGAGGGPNTLGNRSVASSPSPYGSSNFWAVLRTIAKEEGAWALTRGLGPRVLFHIPAGAISWGTYEAGKRMLGITGGGHHH